MIVFVVAGSFALAHLLITVPRGTSQSDTCTRSRTASPPRSSRTRPGTTRTRSTSCHSRCTSTDPPSPCTPSHTPPPMPPTRRRGILGRTTAAGTPTWPPHSRSRFCHNAPRTCSGSAASARAGAGAGTAGTARAPPACPAVPLPSRSTYRRRASHRSSSRGRYRRPPEREK